MTAHNEESKRIYKAIRQMKGVAKEPYGYPKGTILFDDGNPRLRVTVEPDSEYSIQYYEFEIKTDLLYVEVSDPSLELFERIILLATGGPCVFLDDLKAKMKQSEGI